MQTAFLIDGFNFYHSIKNFHKNILWFDYLSFCTHFLRKQDSLHSITYFTAFAFWRQSAVKRHTAFIEACKVNGINVVMGKFKEKQVKCPICHNPSTRHEEKATDVNIALYAYRMASQGIEQVVLVTGDTDLIPAIRLIKTDFPKIQVGVVFPYKRYTGEMKSEAHFSYKTDGNTLGNFVLPQTLMKPNGKIISCPPEWT